MWLGRRRQTNYDLRFAWEELKRKRSAKNFSGVANGKEGRRGLGEAGDK